MRMQANEKMATKSQIQKIHVLLKEKGVQDYKSELVYAASDGRTSSTRELTLMEAKRIIHYLLKDDKEQSKRIVKRIHGLAREMGYIYGSSYEDQCMNAAKLNKFCRERGTVKKDLSSQSLDELKKSLKQFESMIIIYRKRKGKF